MKNYAVFLEGNDFELSRNGHKKALGFFVTVRVEATSEQEAASTATELMKSHLELKEAYEEKADTSPNIAVKVVHELLPENKMMDTEFTFYSMEEE